MSELAVNLGRAIRRRRKELRMTLKTMSKRIGTSMSHLSAVEIGRSNLSMKALERICLELSLSPERLFTLAAVEARVKGFESRVTYQADIDLERDIEESTAGYPV